MANSLENFVSIDEHDEMLFCNVPFSSLTSNSNNPTTSSLNLARLFEILNSKKEQKTIESYSVTQTSLEQIFVQLAGDDEDAATSRRDRKETSERISYVSEEIKFIVSLFLF